MKLELKCECCKRNMFDYKEVTYDVFVNDKLLTMCESCINKIVNKSYDKIEFYLYNYLINFKLKEMNLYNLKETEHVRLDHIFNYNTLKDKQLKKKVKSYLYSFFGGKKNIQNKYKIKDFDFKINVIRENKFKCSVCNKELKQHNYFLKKANSYSLVCYDCYKRGVKNGL